MTTTRNIPDKAPSALSILLQRIDRRLPPKAFFLLALVIILLSGVASLDLSARQTLLTEGDIAPVDVVADSTFLFRDKIATSARQDIARKMQPLIVDLVSTPADAMRNRMQHIMRGVNEAASPEQREALRTQISKDLGVELTPDALNSLAATAVQRAVSSTLLPQLEQRLRSGVIPDVNLARTYPGGVVIRDVVSGEESLQSELFNVPDLNDLEMQLSQLLKESALPSRARQALTLIFEAQFRPTLVPNYEATNNRAAQAVQSVDAVMHRVLRGEIIVQKGDRVSREQQLKMQVLLQRKSERFQLKFFLGIALAGLIISVGLLFSPSGKPSTPMTNKDFVFLSVLLALFALLTRGLAAHGALLAEILPSFLPESLAFAVPIAGASALSAQIFSARRYLVTGLLLAFFCTIMMNGGLALFLFYFMTAMWSTWLTNRNASRRDVVWSVLPMSAGMLAMWAATTMIQGGAHSRYLSELIALGAGAFLSMALTFALAPVVELIFGYTTRFRLMELLNLEQPLLRDLMLTAPGTYHHSLIVSNMCEAGAKRIGAHSLLCKVAALYHDVGKVTKAGYFIENQPTDDNPHTRLAPSMSALILISHVKQGVELAKQHRLGQEVTDIIRQHHGTGIIQYFYRKALSMTDAAPPNIEDFRYPGPRPRSREAAIVMLADIVEASSRTLNEPTPTRLHQHIDNIMKSAYSAGQLDESDLTIRDLSELADSFQQVLRGLYHHRIAYPGQTDAKAKPAKGQVAKAAEPSQPQAYSIVPSEQAISRQTAEGNKDGTLPEPRPLPPSETPPIQ